ncbi:hypothetical protein PoB_001502900 [Plakobranchus ocellatus]|uniref:Uncharacterized protein n=1 Tax=Plakobranchus ocellatus TaxID=259542 RepID=A0AAV3Z3C8_9GAST|nr:hypothetical protein PoB_001502900 [Plakobranchus ocellatus]
MRYSGVSSTGATRKRSYRIYCMKSQIFPCCKENMLFPLQGQGARGMLAASHLNVYEESPQPPTVLFSDCQALVQALKGSDRIDVGEAVLLEETLLRVLGV